LKLTNVNPFALLYQAFGANQTHVAAHNLSAAPLIARTLPVVGKDGAVRVNGLRVNGAAVKPKCRCAARQECSTT
jgi:hypothetical protein